MGLFSPNLHVWRTYYNAFFSQPGDISSYGPDELCQLIHCSFDVIDALPRKRSYSKNQYLSRFDLGFHSFQICKFTERNSRQIGLASLSLDYRLGVVLLVLAKYASQS